MSPTYALSWSRRSGSWRQHFFRPAQPSKKASYKETPLAPNWIDTESCTPRSCVCASLCRPNWTGERSCSVSSTWVNYRPDVSHLILFFFLGRSNTRLAEANSKLLNERSRSFITSSIANGSLVNPSLDVGALVSPGVTLNRSLGLGVLSPGSEGQNSRVEDYLAKVSTRTQLITETGEWFFFFSSPSYLRFIDLIVVSVVFCWYIQLKLVPSLFFLSVVNDGASIVSSVSHSFSF